MSDAVQVSFVPMASVEAGTGRVDTSTLRDFGDVKRGYTIFQENDIIFAKITPCMENGKAAVARSLKSGIGIGSTEFHVLRTENDIDPQLLYYYLARESFRQAARNDMTGSAGQLRVPATFISNTPYPLAPSKEQQRIVAVIEEQLTILDASVASLKRDKEKLKRARASVLKYAVEGKLTAAWRADHPTMEPASALLKRILAERRAKWEADQLAKMSARGVTPKDNKWQEAYKEPSLPDTKNLFVLPEEWLWVTLETVASIQLGKMLSPKAYDIGLIQLPYLRNENVRWGSIDYDDVKKMGFADRELEKYRLEAGDLLVCEGGEAGRCAIYKADMGRYMYQKALHRVRAFNDGINLKFIQFCMQHYVASKIVIPKPSETTIQHLPLEKMQVLSFPLPPLAEQEQIVAEVERRLSIIAQSEATIEASLKRAERTRQSILEKAFSGRLVAQDPADEPASVLLERIQQQRKKREQDEMQRRKDVGMNVSRKARSKKTAQQASLLDVLIEEQRPMPPDDLFGKAGLQVDAEEDEDVKEFFAELDEEVSPEGSGRIRVLPDKTKVLLEAAVDEA